MLDRLAELELGNGDYALATVLYDSVAALGAGSGYWQWKAAEGAVLRDAIEGRISDSEARRRRASEFLVEQGWGGTYLWRAEWAAWTRLLGAEDAEGAARILDEALARYPIETVPDGEAPVLGIAFLSAALGRTEDAEALLARDRAAGASLYGQGWDTAMRTLAEAQLLGQAGDVEGAVEHLNSLERSVCPECGQFWTGFLLEEAGDAAGAIAAWEEYLSHGWHVRHILDADGLGSVYESLGQLYDSEGDLEQAAVNYARFVELWADADPELQPRVRAAQARLEEIVRERG
jgi:tetratricopeptide (TPR) repeat protein